MAQKINQKQFGTKYSTDEQLTGDVWIDGKIIYKRTFSGTITAAANTIVQTPLVGSGIEAIVDAGGHLWDAPSGGHIAIPGSWLVAGGGSYLSGGFNYSGGAITLRSYGTSPRTGAPYTATVYYTKT